MASQIKNSTPQEQNDWAPSLWDLYGDASQVIMGLKRKADVRVSFSPYELGGDAGRFILDQYYAAKGETSLGTVTQAALSSNNIKMVLAKTLPLAGFVAAIGIDYAVFGSASEGVGSAHMPFDLNPFAVGSLVFAVGLGLAVENKNLIKATMLIATFGAALISADNSTLRNHFTQTIASYATTGSDDVEARISKLKSDSMATKAAIDYNYYQINKGGNKGNGILADGNKANDILVSGYLTNISNLEKEQTTINNKLGNAKAELNETKRTDWTDGVGRVLAALYTGSWLAAAQLMVAGVIRSAPSAYKEGRDKIASHIKQKKFVLDLENPNEKIRQPAIRMAVIATLSRFSEILSTSKNDSKQASKMENIANLFEEESYNKMVTAATGMVTGGIIPRKPSLMKRIVSRLNNRSQNVADPVPNASSLDARLEQESNENSADASQKQTTDVEGIGSSLA